MAEILVTKPGALNEQDKEVLRAAGVIVVEADEPTAVRFIRPTAELDSSDLALAAMRSLRHADSTSANRLFVKLIDDALAVKEPRHD